MQCLPSTNDHKPFTKSIIKLTGFHHPLGALLPYLRLENIPKNSQGFCSQLVRSQAGWMFLIPQLSLIQDDLSDVILSTCKYEIRSIDEHLAQKLAIENGQESQFLAINKLMGS